MSLQFIPSAFDIASQSLICSLRGLTECLSNGSVSGSSLPLTSQRESSNNCPKIVAHTYSTSRIAQKRARSKSPIPTSRKSAKNLTTPHRQRKVSGVIEDSITSPYFPPTPKRDDDACAPIRRKTGGKGSSVASPYFAASQKQHDDLPLKRRRKRRKATRVIEEEVLPIINPPDLWWETEELPVKDVISFTHFRTHSRLYYELWLAKPTLIQESISDDPWKLLIAVMLLNKTSGKFAIPIFWEILDQWPTPLLLSQADESELMTVIRSLGLQRTRSKRLVLLSKMYLDDPPIPDVLRPSTFKLFGEPYAPTAVSHLPGSGAYALDSYRIFYSGNGSNPDEWKSVMPSDKELIRYLRWKWAFEERKKWGPDSGVLDDVDTEYLERLPCLLQK